jgi:hypothetical protein
MVIIKYIGLITKILCRNKKNILISIMYIYSKKNKKKLIACIYKSSKKVNNRLDFN